MPKHLEKLKQANLSVSVDTSEIDEGVFKLMGDSVKQANKKKDIGLSLSVVKHWCLFKKALNDDVMGVMARFSHLAPHLQEEILHRVKRRKTEENFARGDVTLTDLYGLSFEKPVKEKKKVKKELTEKIVDVKPVDNGNKGGKNDRIN